MISYTKEINALFDLYFDEQLTEHEVLLRSIDLVKSHNFDKDYMFDLNDVLYNLGYSFQFDVPEKERKAFDNSKYCEISTNVSKSKDKTKALIDYLNAVSDSRLWFASIRMLKIKHLIALGYLQTDNEIILSNTEKDIRTLLFEYYLSDEEVVSILVSTLEDMGMSYATYDYMAFRFDVEYLLWTIERDDINYGYLKTNTLKVATNIAPKEYFIRDGKNFFNPKFSKVTKDYLKLIDQEEINNIKEFWGEEGNEADGTGYLVLYKLLTTKNK